MAMSAGLARGQLKGVPLKTGRSAYVDAFVMPINDVTVWNLSFEGIMLIDLLVWLGVVFAAYIAWSLYNGIETFPEDRDAPRRED